MFLPPCASLAELRRETRRALLAGQKAAAYEIICEEYIYPGHFLQTLRRIESLHAPDTCGLDGTLFCCALWDGETGAGLLVHRGDKGALCAYLPTLSYERALQEDAMAKELVRFSRLHGDTPVFLPETIPAGQYSLDDLLRILAGAI